MKTYATLSVARMQAGSKTKKTGEKYDFFPKGEGATEYMVGTAAEVAALSAQKPKKVTKNRVVVFPCEKIRETAASLVVRVGDSEVQIRRSAIMAYEECDIGLVLTMNSKSLKKGGAIAGFLGALSGFLEA